MVARRASGEIVAYDPVEMVVDPTLNLLDYLVAPARVSDALKLSAQELAERTVEVAKTLAVEPEQAKSPIENATLTGAAGGIWELETGWGRQQLDFTKGIISFIDDDFGPYNITSSSYGHPELRFEFSVDKGGWDFEVSFEGKVSGEKLEGAYFPMDTPVAGNRIAKA